MSDHSPCPQLPPKRETTQPQNLSTPQFFDAKAESSEDRAEKFNNLREDDIEPRSHVAALSLTEVISPFESEAETHILKVIEERERSTRVFQSSKAVLGGLTTTDAMELDMQMENVMTAASEDKEEEKKQDEEAGAVDAASDLASYASKQTSMGSRQRILSADYVDDSKPERAETTLFDLAHQLRSIHKAGQKDHHEEIKQDLKMGRRQLASSDIGRMDALLSKRNLAPTSAVDDLVNDAVMLFRGNTKENKASSVRNSADDPKKNDDVATPTVYEQGEEVDEESDVELGGSPPGEGSDPDLSGEESSRSNKHVKSSMYQMAKRHAIGAKQHAKDDIDHFHAFLKPRKGSALSYVRVTLLYIILPALGIATLLFYVVGNPRMRHVGDASISWFIIFLCIRQVVTFTFARISTVLFIEYLALKTTLLLRLFGSYITLTIVQSKGWPSLMSWWAFYDLLMLSGDGRFARHWLFYQPWIKMFNEENPAGEVTQSVWNFRILVAGLVVGIIVSVKRFVVGLYLGRRQYATYGAKLARIIQDMIIVSKVARLARRLEREGTNSSGGGHEVDNVPQLESFLSKDTQDAPVETAVPFASSSFTERNMIIQLLGDWEEPEGEKIAESVSMKGILQYKQTLAFMDLSYPFSAAFGLADTRENAIKSAQGVYDRLLLGNPAPDRDVLQFQTMIDAVREGPSQQLDEALVKDLIRIFRPDRQGRLELIDFVRSVDSIYKELKMLRASIHSSAAIDTAFEWLINIVFYFIVFCIVLAAWGLDPLALFLSLSSVLLALTFAIGGSSAKYFEGILFIVARQPYDIGDRISLDGPMDKPGLDGVFTWFVDKVTLYYTTLRLGATNEVATIANSVLSGCRIVNAARSPKAVVYVNLKFGIDVPYGKIQIFRESVMSFVKNRPREWLACSDIRATSVMEDQGYVQYICILQHRESWQNIGAVLKSKADVTSFCLEAQKKLGMRYVTPAMPINLKVSNDRVAEALGVPHTATDYSVGTASPRHQRTDSQFVEDLRGLEEWFAPKVE